jgi:alpha-L-rhamnosidase
MPLRTSLCTLLLLASAASASAATTLSATDAGATGDGKTLNTPALQKAIDTLAAKGGGTLLIPKGVFVSGALFFKPGVHLRLDKDAVLQCSTDLANFPPQRTRIEGHFEEHFNPALINASTCDGFTISGEGTLDGNGRPIWDEFWKRRNAAPDRKNFPNLSVPRARLCIIDNSKSVSIDGITFKDSQYWNLHLYKCQNVTISHARFEVPDNYKQAPSTDGIDVDSSQNITIKNCFFSVTDDCIAMKGTKGPLALEDKDSPPDEHVRISDCTFKRGNAAVTLGSDASVARDILFENSAVTGSMPVLLCKLRPDTPQTFEDVHAKNITVDNPDGTLLTIAPWTQYNDLQGHTPPTSTVRNITLENITGRTGSFATLQANPGQTTITDIHLKNITLHAKDPALKGPNAKSATLENVTLNDKPA